LSIAAGTFLFIAATDLLPEVMKSAADRRERSEAALGFMLGALVIGVQVAA
jgi:zinc transporter ZupT